MRHQVYGRKLNRTSKQRKALFKNLVSSLFERGAIETTEAKAKSIKGLVDTLIHKAQQGSVATARVLASFFGTRAIVARLMNEIAPAMKDRVSGFTRIIRLGNRRGDNAETVRIELVVKPEPVQPKAVVPKKVEAGVKKEIAPKTVVQKEVAVESKKAKPVAKKK